MKDKLIIQKNKTDNRKKSKKKSKKKTEKKSLSEKKNLHLKKKNLE